MQTSAQAGEAFVMTLTDNTGNALEGMEIGLSNGKKLRLDVTLNGKHPSLGVAQQTLVNGDKVIFHYTDAYYQGRAAMGSWRKPPNPQKQTPENQRMITKKN